MLEYAHNHYFLATDGANAAGMTYLRVPLGASDFSASGGCWTAQFSKVNHADCMLVAYTYDDTSGDTALNDFNINAAPSYVFSTIADILSVNDIIKIHVCPWSPVSIDADR